MTKSILNSSSTINLISIAVIIASVAVLAFLQRTVVNVEVTSPPSLPPTDVVTVVRDEEEPPPEYRRGGPYRDYRPRNFQQIGLLTETTTGEVLPLWGRGAPNYRDRWNYYSSTPGQQIYSLPVTSADGRDCTEDMGCNELYGGETVTVFGQSGAFEVKIYRIEQYPYYT